MAHNVQDFATSAKADPAGTGFVLDFDGTLSAIAPTPAEAVALPGAEGVLGALSDRYALVAVLSGRRAEDVAGLIPVKGVRYLGLYGAEELRPGAPLSTPRRPPGRLVEEARAFLQQEGLTGAEVEDKGHSVALHYRNATTPGAAGIIGGWAVRRADELGLQVRPGKMVVELTPPGPSKADALERLVTEEGLRRVVVAGDDVADVGALQRAGTLLDGDALRIGVRSPEAPTDLEAVADVMVPGPEGVLELLGRFV